VLAGVLSPPFTNLKTMHLLFDLDGTLTDPKQGILGCIRHALQALDIEIDPDTPLEPCIGPPLRDSFRRLCGADSSVERIEAAVSLYRERFSTLGLFENRVYDGIPQCLQALRASVDTLHLATSKPAVYAHRIVEHFGLEQHLDGVYGSELDGRLGDKTELIKHIVDCENLQLEKTVMIGDRSFDVIGARNNRVLAIGALWGYGTADELRQAGADYLCASPRELPDLLSRVC
jgi:phosphoglycolate phosphatase